jgi:copper chaperone CopZ
MGTLIKFLAKKTAEVATSVASGAATAVVGAVSETAKAAVGGVMNVQSDVSGRKIRLTEEKLVQLKKLYDAGLINETEYQAKKAQIIKNVK